MAGLFGIKEKAQKLDEQYGKGFGFFYFLLLFAACFAFFALVGWLVNVNLDITDTKEFVLDSSSKYKIELVLPSKISYYFEVDLSKKSVVKRADSEDGERQKVKNLETNIDDLALLITEVTDEPANVGLTAEEREAIYSTGCYWIFRIETSSGEEYYVKDLDQINRLKVLLDER